MRKNPQKKCVLFSTTLIYATFSIADVPPEIFSINSVTIGSTTLQESQKTYGKAQIKRRTNDDQSDIYICYQNGNASESISFESGPMGGFSQITSYQLSSHTNEGTCSTTPINIKNLTTLDSVGLGITRSDFAKKLGIDFKESNSELIYEKATQRNATKEELSRIRSQWPNEGQDYFDVQITIKAKFISDRLSDLYVEKIESF